MQLTFENGKFWSSKNKFPLTLKEAVKLKGHADEKALKVFNRTLARHYETYELPPLKFLDPHQREGIKWILKRSRSYLAHAPGAGKTCQAIVAGLLIPEPGKILFVVPPSLTENWLREITQFSEIMGLTPDTAVLMNGSNPTKQELMKADFIIVTDSMLAKISIYQNILDLDLKFIAVDEASRFKEPTSQRSKAFYGGKINDIIYPGLFQDTRHTVFLDGSPMVTGPMDLWAPTYSLNPSAIDYFSYSDFGFRFGGAKTNERGEWQFKGSSHEDELHQRLTKDFMHVIPESALSHPERRRSILFMNEDVRTPEMKSWEQKNLKKLKLEDVTERKSQGALATHRKEIGLRKVRWSSNYIKDRLKEKNESILIFAWHREVCEQLAEKLKEFNPFIIYGGVSGQKRERALKEFKEGKRKALVLNIQAGGRGHNIQEAQRIIFVEYSWSDELNKQCEKRASRRGNNKRFVRCEYVCASGTMDEVILQTVFRREKTVKRVIG